METGGNRRLSERSSERSSERVIDRRIDQAPDPRSERALGDRNVRYVRAPMKLMETGSDLKIVHIKRGSNRWANILKIFKQARNTYRFCFTLQKTNKYNYYSKSQWRPKHMFSRVSKESSIGSMPGRFVNLNESTRLPRLA